MDILSRSLGGAEDQNSFVDLENPASSEDESNDTRHDQLLDCIKSFGRQKWTTVSSRTEASATVSEFAIESTRDKKLEVDSLLSPCGKSAALTDLRKSIVKANVRVDVVPSPCLKPQYEKINRTIAYKKVCKDVSKWDTIVKQNREAEHLSFPLNSSYVREDPIGEVVKRFKLSTPLELEMAAVLQQNQPNDDPKDASENENNKIKSLDLIEALELRREMRKIRARQSYLVSKFNRMKKIKSKSYHRILKREKLKKALKEFEELQKTNPELASEKVQEMERARALERMTQRHRNTGKWAKYNLMRAKYDKNERSIQEQIELGRSLTAKQHVSDSDDDSEQDLNEENPEEKNVELKFDSFNPWLLTNGNREVTPTADVECKTAGYRKFWEEKNKRCQEKPTDNGSNNLDENDDASTDNDSANLSKELNDLNRDEEMEVQTTHDPKTKFDDGTECNEEAEYMDEVDEIFDRLKTKNTANTKISPSSTEEADVDISKANLSSCTRELYNHREPQMKETTVRKRTLEDFDRPNMDDPFSLTNSKTKSRYFVHPVLSADKKSNDDDELASPDTSIDPRNFITVNPKVIKYRAPNLEDLDDDAIDDKCEDEVNAEHRMNIIEAFADDDVIEEFQMQKQAIVEGSKPKHIDLELPGWGEWGGHGVVPTLHKKKSRMFETTPTPKRRDSSLGNVIINEKADDKLKPYLVKEIPYPFSTKEEFESNIKEPIGKNWNPETAFERLILPQVVTKLGTTIEPISKEMLSGSSQNANDKYRMIQRNSLPL